MTAYSGTQARTICAWSLMEKEAASATRRTGWGAGGAGGDFIRKEASELTWKHEWEPAKQVGVKGTVQGMACAKCTGRFRNSEQFCMVGAEGE